MKCTRHRVVGLLCAGWVGSVVGLAATTDESTVSYRPRLTGLWPGELKSAVREQSLTIRLRDHPPASTRQLARRAADDLPSMTAALRTAGYLEAGVSVDIETNRPPVRVTFRAIKGPRYTVSTFQVVYTNAVGSVPRFPRRLGLRPQSPADVKAVEAAEGAVLRFLQERGYPDPQKVSRRVTRDSEAKTVHVVTAFSPGPRATLGEPAIRGCVRLSEAHLRRQVTWNPGDRYSVKAVEELERDLLRSGLFVSARVTVSNAVDAAGNLPVQLNVAEREHRTVRAGVSYYTDEGVGGQVGWENRNLFGDAESLTFGLTAAEIERRANGVFTRPDLFGRDLDLSVEAEAAYESPDAYESRKERVAMLLEREIGKDLSLSAGTAYELDRVDEDAATTRYDLVSLPLALEWDRRDDKLDPARGTALHLAMTPYRDVRNDLTYLQSVADASGIVKLSRSRLSVLALRGTLGTITGEDAANVPADKRFYAGGGGTVRGYAYQTVGELDEDGDAVGGGALATLSTELRARVSPSLGGVLFVDGGTAYPGTHPDGDTALRWGAGAGLRYYLGSAPLRLDVAFPLQRRDDIDDAYQFYVSLGQSF